MSFVLISHPVFAEHAVPEGHPERPGRIESVWSALQDIDEGVRVDAKRATRAQLLRVHTQAHVDAINASAPVGGLVHIDHETTMGPASLEAVERAAGSVCQAVDLVLSGEATRVFCAVRPPGHHARAHTVAGFCVYNSIAVGAAHALAADGIQRVAIVDYDVHHGDGTESMFRENPAVLACSTYQHPLYPDVNLPSLPGSQINVPLPAGSGSAAFRHAIETQWLPELERFAPDLVMISAGFDAHRDDPLGGLQLVEDDFAWATAAMLEVAQRHSAGRAVAVLEGGYDLAAVGSCARAVVDVLRAS